MKLSPADRLEIFEAQNFYGFVFDGRWEFLDRVFTADAEFDASESTLPAVRGLAAIQEHVTEFHSGLRTNHMATNSSIVDVRDDGVVTAITKYLVLLNGGVLVSGTYEDELVKTAAGWRISKRRLKLNLVMQGTELSPGELIAHLGNKAG
jgi:SnoaL-like domain